MSLMQIVGMVEAVIILALSEPVLNKMSPCAPLVMRMAFHAIAIGSALRLLHIFTGHAPSWSALLQVGGLALLLICGQFQYLRLTDRRRTDRKRQADE